MRTGRKGSYRAIHLPVSLQEHRRRSDYTKLIQMSRNKTKNPEPLQGLQGRVHKEQAETSLSPSPKFAFIKNGCQLYNMKFSIRHFLIKEDKTEDKIKRWFETSVKTWRQTDMSRRMEVIQNKSIWASTLSHKNSGKHGQGLAFSGFFVKIKHCTNDLFDSRFFSPLTTSSTVKWPKQIIVTCKSWNDYFQFANNSNYTSLKTEYKLSWSDENSSVQRNPVFCGR